MALETTSQALFVSMVDSAIMAYLVASSAIIYVAHSVTIFSETMHENDYIFNIGEAADPHVTDELNASAVPYVGIYMYMELGIRGWG